MNTRTLPAILSLIAGFVTCVMAFVQHVDSVEFAKRFVIVCLIFYGIGVVISIVININFKEMSTSENEEAGQEELLNDDELENLEELNEEE